MATRSAIAIRHGDRIKAVSCHWDGYPDGVGAILQENYLDSVKLSKLISMGDISSLGEEIGQTHPFSQFECTPEEWNEELFSTWTTFYGRDRGEVGGEYKSFATTAEFVDFYTQSWCEYFYLYDHGTWLVRGCEGEFKSLLEVINQVQEA